MKKYIYIYIYFLNEYETSIVRARFGSLAQRVKRFQPKEPNSMNL